jgi:Uri superfamily endonuclease
MQRDIPAQPGNYVLFLWMDEIHRLMIGRLGFFEFPVGCYMYCGSALGPGGLRARINHHINGTAQPIWHLDYLRPYTRRIGCAYSITHNRLECVWREELSKMEGARFPVPGFGAADCRSGCSAHLIFLPRRPDRQEILKIFKNYSIQLVEY